MRCGECGHEQDEGRFCGRCGARSQVPSRHVRDESEDADVEHLARPTAAEPDEDRLARAAWRWQRPAAVVGLMVVLAGFVVFTSDDFGEPPPTASPEAAEPDEADPDRDGPDPDVEVRTEEIGAADAPVVPALRAEVPGDTYCWWKVGADQTCDAWAVESALGAPFSQVVAAGERVIVTVEDAVAALDSADGAVLWTWRDEVPALVAATATRVFVTDGGDRTVGLDAATGVPVWEAEVREGRWLWQSVGDGVVVNREPSSLVLYAAEDGELLWERNVQSAGADGTPVIAGEVIITMAGGELVGYARTNGEQLWQVPLAPVMPAVHWPDGEIVVVAEEDRLIAVEPTTGGQVWTRPTEGVEQLADVDGNTVAVTMPDRVDLVDRHTGTVVAPVHAPGMRAIRPVSDGRFFARTGTSSLQRWQTDPLGPRWNLNVRMPTDATYAVIERDGGAIYVVAPITDGTTVAAFRVTERPLSTVRSAHSCDGAHPSWHLSRLSAWAGQDVHVALLTDGTQQQQLWIGIPDQHPTASFTVSARPLDTTGEARFSHFSEDWRQELAVDSGGRTAADFPPHWVVAADFPQPGCWEIRVSGDQVDDTVVIPVPAANNTNG